MGRWLGQGTIFAWPILTQIGVVGLLFLLLPVGTSIHPRHCAHVYESVRTACVLGVLLLSRVTASTISRRCVHARAQPRFHSSRFGQRQSCHQMRRYRRLFSTTRIPDRDCDELSHLRVGHHVVVQRNGYARVHKLAQTAASMSCFCRCSALKVFDDVKVSEMPSTVLDIFLSSPWFAGTGLCTLPRNSKKPLPAFASRRTHETFRIFTQVAGLGFVAANCEH